MDQESEPEERESPVWTESNDGERLQNVNEEVAMAITLSKRPGSDSESSGDSDFEYDYE